MNNSIKKISIITLMIFISGCANSYKPINPTTLEYNRHNHQDGIDLSYEFEVLRERGNKKLANKEGIYEIKLIAVKITNNTDSILNISKNVAFYSGQNQIFPVEPLEIRKLLKQHVLGYTPYMVLSFLQLRFNDSGEKYQIGLIIAPIVTGENMSIASKANKNMLKELNEYNILNKDIKKGETVYGIFGVKNIGFSPISVKMIK